MVDWSTCVAVEQDPAVLSGAFGVLWSDVRERAWVGRLLAGNEWPVLFICGADHCESIELLWKSLGLPATIVHRDYEP